MFVKRTQVSIIPVMMYHDASAAIDWLCDTFGFTKHSVHKGKSGDVIHAELLLGNGMVMLGGVKATEFCKSQQTPRQLGGTTQSCYVIVTDPDGLHDRAVKAGADIVLPLSDKPYGSRDFSCRDPEGHLWNFGTYDPWSTAS
jgi:uncharacterized glyoxalase superfamily protein PhnB